MHIYEMVSRIKQMKSEHVKILRHEKSVAKMGAKYLLELEGLQNRIRNEKLKRDSKVRLQILENTNDALRILCQKETENLKRSKEKVIQLQEEYQKCALNIIEKERNQADIKKSLNNLTLISKIHFNTQTLPHVLQGMSISSQNDERHFIPFRFQTNQIKEGEASSIIWENEQHSSGLSKQWDYLVFGNNT